MEVPVAPVLFKKRNAKSNATTRKRPATPPSASGSDSGFTSSEEEEGRQVKRRRRDIGVTASSTANVATRAQTETDIASVAQTRPTNADDATKALDWYDEGTASGKKESAPPGAATEATPSDGIYKGIGNYQSYVQKNPDRQSKQVGPVKSSTNVRTITVTDFAPDVCKDYKQTGFCGFGDSCKFLHAREDYKQGWQLDRDWEIGTKGKKLTGRTVASAGRSEQANPEDEDDEKLLESIPFACIICKQAYKNPIITKCQHYFCEACALRRYKKDPSCAACGTGTGGVFNVAKKLNRLLERKREREQQKQEKAAENE